MEKEYNLYAVFTYAFVILLIIIVIASIGGFNMFKKTITGFATQPVVLNITVGVPQITFVYNNTMTDVSSGLNAGPSSTSVKINFTAYTAAGAGNLNHSTARINFTKSNEDLRQNTSCNLLNSAGNYANYTCTVAMWWWDSSGAWNIGAYIEDNNTNSAINTSTTFSVGSTTGFELSPGTLTWPGIAPGSTNQTSNNDPLLLNNTGNQAIGISSGNITINSTNLRGESNSALAIWAGNMSMHWATGGTPPAECGGSVMTKGLYANITGANLTRGNYSINNGATGQEQLYICIKLAGSELTSQPYSTANESTWTVQI